MRTMARSIRSDVPTMFCAHRQCMDDGSSHANVSLLVRAMLMWQEGLNIRFVYQTGAVLPLGQHHMVVRPSAEIRFVLGDFGVKIVMALVGVRR